MPALESDPHSGRCFLQQKNGGGSFFFPLQATAFLELIFFLGGGVD